MEYNPVAQPSPLSPPPDGPPEPVEETPPETVEETPEAVEETPPPEATPKDGRVTGSSRPYRPRHRPLSTRSTEQERHEQIQAELDEERKVHAERTGDASL